MIPNRFVILWDEKPVGLDNSSGGYPFKTENPSFIKFWETKKDAQVYIEVMQGSNTDSYYQNMKIIEVQFKIWIPGVTL